MALAVISILGLVGPTLTFVKQAQDINAGTSCIEKMNTILETAPFWDTDAALKYETVYQWVLSSDSDSPTIFIFYDEIPPAANANSSKTPLQRVVRYNPKHNELNTPLSSMAIVNNYQNDPLVPNLPVYRNLSDFVTAAAESRVYGPVIAMTLSPSPLMKNFPNTDANNERENTWYQDPPHNGLFPTQQGMTKDPSGLTGNIYPEGYFPIYIQAFTLTTDTIQSSQDVSSFGAQLINSLTAGTRLFTYTTAKLR